MKRFGEITCAYTSHDWEFGIGFTIPATTGFHGGMKLYVPFGVTIHLGPFAFDFRGNDRIIAFRCALCGYTHTGEPAHIGPLPGLVACSDCHEMATRATTPTVVRLHADDCDGNCGQTLEDDSETA